MTSYLVFVISVGDGDPHHFVCLLRHLNRGVIGVLDARGVMKTECRSGTPRSQIKQ